MIASTMLRSKRSLKLQQPAALAWAWKATLGATLEATLEEISEEISEALKKCPPAKPEHHQPAKSLSQRCLLRRQELVQIKERVIIKDRRAIAQKHMTPRAPREIAVVIAAHEAPANAP
jgi:hypothetical protein